MSEQIKYSQRKASWAITKASLRALFRSPSAVIFSFGFPLIFILVFGFVGGGNTVIKVGIKSGSDTSGANALYSLLKVHQSIKIVTKPEKELFADLQKGRITALLEMHPNKINLTATDYLLQIHTSTASADKLGLLQTIIRDLVHQIDKRINPQQPTYAKVEVLPPMSGRVYRTIDFILPGQLGFSLLSAGVFGVAFIFFNLRQTLVLKRFFATPVSRLSILAGEGLARIIFQLMTAVVIILIGHFAFEFTLVNGWITFLEMLLLSFIGLVIFMGFGFVVSGLARSESVIPPFANLFTLPQFLLAGTFFPIENFPIWLQPVCRILPLTHLNEAMRNVAFEGMHITDCASQIGILLVWGILTYAVAVRVFRWE